MCPHALLHPVESGKKRRSVSKDTARKSISSPVGDSSTPSE